MLYLLELPEVIFPALSVEEEAFTEAQAVLKELAVVNDRVDREVAFIREKLRKDGGST